MLLCSAAWIDKECPGEEKEAFWDTAAESGPAIVGPSQDSYGRFCWVDWLWSDKCLSDQSQQSVEWVYGVCDQFVMNLNNAVCVCIDWLIDWLIDQLIDWTSGDTNASRRQEFFRRWTVSVELSACYITWQRHLTLYSLRDFWRHFCLSRAAAHSDCCFFCAVYKYSYLLTYLVTYLLT